ncbi:MAG: CocE/NonD family hydrolase [Gammaproteobacteria bacterium]|nr:CocE/NonD family hydrolase [Gammaproteobacteria bacterium]
MAGLGTAQETRDFPYPVTVHENIWIPLCDGVRFAAKLWLPQAAGEKLGTVLEYLPYRKRDGTAVRDALTHPYFAGHGFACLRVDMRGCGESDGLMHDEYLAREQDDALEIIDWITAQTWSNGRVGMMGISWGGFNSLQVASRQPQGLRGVITLCSTDDRYADDIHYKGGALLNENQGWGSTMLGYQSRPPDPALRDDWRELWLRRLEHMPFFPHKWLSHPHRDGYWRHGSVGEDFPRIRAAVLAIGGWGDAYSNAVPRLVEGLRGERAGIIGPWVHKYPHFAVPAPAIGFLQLACYWWGRHLRDEPADNGPLSARYYVYLMDAAAPAPAYAERGGNWYAFERWPDVDTGGGLSFNLSPGRLSLEPSKAHKGGTITIRSPQTVGAASGEYCAIWLGPELPLDQRRDDALSATFDTLPLEHDVPIVGAPVLHARFAADAPVAQLAVRLCDVWPDGRSTRITYTVLNLTHHSSHEQPEALAPGRQNPCTLRMDDVAYKVPAGHRLRLSLSTAYWPLIWPSPTAVSVTLDLAEAGLHIPLLPDEAQAAQPFAPAVSAPPLEQTELRPERHTRELHEDLATGAQVLTLEDDFGRYRNDEHGLITETVAGERYNIAPDDPLSAHMQTHWTEVVARGEWCARTETRTELRADEHYFYVSAQIDAYEDEIRVFNKRWRERVRRDRV